MSNPSFTKAASAVWVDGVDPDKADIRTWAATVESALDDLISSPGLINGSLSVSVASNVLTLAVKTAAGADPSSSDPVYVVVRNATVTSGLPVVRKLTAATSLTVSAGATLGTVADTSFELLLVAFDDGGTVRLGVYNPFSGSTFYPVDEDQVSSSTAEGGDGSADSAGTFYTGTAVSSVGFRILARLAWTSGLGTAGLWSALPTHIVSVPDSAHLVNVSPPGKELAKGNRGKDRFKILTSDATGADSASVQPWFPSTGAVTLEEGYYYFEGVLRLSRSAGAVSHTTATLFGGTATLSFINYFGEAKTGDTNALAGVSGFWATDETALVVKAASTATTEQTLIRVRGWVSVSTAGTLIPQFQYSAAPGGAPTVVTGSFFRLVPLGTGATQGTWS